MAKDINLNSSDWRDIVFEGKNHKYGAYYLRSTSSKRHIAAFIIVFICVLVLAAVPSLIEVVKANTAANSNIDEEFVITDVELDTPPEDVPPVIPDAPPPPPKIETIQYTPPVIVEDSKVKKENKVQAVEELDKKKDAVISYNTQEGEKLDRSKEKLDELLKNQKDEAGTGPIDSNRTFEVVEQMPQYPGGNGALMQFLSSNIKYPTIAAENGVEGRVTVRFVVSKDGSIKDVKVAKSVDPALDKEAVRVVKSMPNWIPGKQNGRAVNVYYNVPVTFKLQK